jgi:ankyrin repeat protein
MTDADPCQRKSKVGEPCGILFNRCGTGYTCSGSICKPTVVDVDDIMKLINDANIVQLKELLKEIKPLEEKRRREDSEDPERRRSTTIINDTDCKGFTPLMRAVVSSVNNISILLSNYPTFAANMREKDEGRDTLIRKCLRSVQIISLLLEHYSDKNKQNKLDGNKTALMYSIDCAQLEPITELLKYNNPSINFKSTDGTTALMQAISSKLPLETEDLLFKKVDLLLKNGADPNVKNNSGQTARDLVSLMDIPDKEKIIKLLEEREIEIRTPRGLYSRTNKESLGEGSFGEVFRVKKNNENLVLKRFILDDSIRTGENTIKTTKPNIFLKETEIFSKFKNNKYVMKYLNSGTSKNSKTGFIVTESLKGKELYEAIKKKLINDGNIQQITEDLLMGLDEIHKAGVLHLDIKPENIWFMQDPGTTIKYFDFGLSCNEIPCNTAYPGSPGYMKKAAILEEYEKYVSNIKKATTKEEKQRAQFEYNNFLKTFDPNPSHDKTDDFYALARTLADILIGFGKTEEENIRNNNIFKHIAEGGEWAMTDVLSVESQNRLAGVIRKLVKLTPTQNAIDALTPTAGGRRRSKTRRRRSQQQKQRRQSRRN